MGKVEGVERVADQTDVRYLTRRVAVVQWRGYWFTISQVSWGPLRRLLYRVVYRQACPPDDVCYETAVFLSHRDGRFNPQKPLHMSYQTSRSDARTALCEVVEQVAHGSMPFQTFFQK